MSAADSVFKECDIRGRYPHELDEALFERVGAALGAQVVDRCRCPEHAAPVVMVGGDVRASTPRLKARLLAGLARHPLRCADLGTVPTPVLYWAKATGGAAAAAMVTASHNPPDWNGLKVMIGDRPPLPEEVAALGAGSAACELSAAGPARGAAAVETWRTVREAYAAEIEALFAGQGIERLSVVLDAGNGCQAGLASHVFAKVGAETFALHDWPDGAFPCRHPDTSRHEQLGAIREAVVQRGAGMGIAFDGDGDRLAVIDERGHVLAAEQLAMLLLAGPLRPQPGAVVVLDVKCSAKLEERVRELGGEPRRSKSGHAHMKREVIASGAVLGVEASGHLFLGRLNGRDDPLVTALLLAAQLVHGGHSLAALVDELPVMAVTPDIRIPTTAVQADALLARWRDGIADARVDTLDGVRLLWDDGWALLRRSITEPAVTMRMEGRDGAALGHVLERVADAMDEWRPLLIRAAGSAGRERERDRREEARGHA